MRAAQPAPMARGRGFTLVERLVVIAIIGILVAMLLPAVQAARESARRTQCVNQLKQMALGCLNVVDTLGMFPTGGDGVFPMIENYVQGGRALGPQKQGLSWGFQILPYLEEGAVHGITTTQQLEQTEIGMYQCPSRRKGVKLKSLATDYDGFVQLTDYAGATPCTSLRDIGTGATQFVFNPAEYTPVTRRTYTNAYASFFQNSPFLIPPFGVYEGAIIRSPFRLAGKNNRYQLLNPGVGEFASGVTRFVDHRKLTDGSSKTILVAEKYVRVDAYEGKDDGSGEGYNSDDKGWTDGWDPDTMRSTCFAPVPDSSGLDDNGTYKTGNVVFFGSAHTGGINAAFADGSVRRISYDVEPVTFNFMGWRDDGEVIDLD